MRCWTGWRCTTFSSWNSAAVTAQLKYPPKLRRIHDAGGPCSWLHDPLLRRSVCAAGQPAYSQVRRRIRLSASDRKFPRLTGRSGTQRARRLLPRMSVGSSAPWSSSPPSDLRITSVFPCVARAFKARPSFMFADCCWWRSLAIDGGSGTSRGHGSVMRRPRSRWDGAVERPSANGVAVSVAVRKSPQVAKLRSPLVAS
jgi:hypothetical protein